MKYLFLLLILAAFAKTSHAQGYDVVVRDSVPYMVTDQDSVGAAVDTLSLQVDLQSIDQQLEEIRIQELQIELHIKKTALLRRREFLSTVVAKTKEACASLL